MSICIKQLASVINRNQEPGTKNQEPMSNLLNQSAAHKLAKTIGIRLGSTGIQALNERIERIIKEAAVKSRKDHRKTILDRDIHHEPDLFS